jgi:hypothetical protein
MIYEKPVIVDLSDRSEKGFGEEGCRTGSGEANICFAGPTASVACDLGGTDRSSSGKYED